MQAFLSSASPLCFMQTDRSAEPGGRAAAAVAAAVKRWAAVLSDHSYPSSKSSLQANHMELSRPTPRSTSSTQQLHTHARERAAGRWCALWQRLHAFNGRSGNINGAGFSFYMSASMCRLAWPPGWYWSALISYFNMQKGCGWIINFIKLK